MQPIRLHTDEEAPQWALKKAALKSRQTSRRGIRNLSRCWQRVSVHIHGLASFFDGDPDFFLTSLSACTELEDIFSPRRRSSFLWRRWRRPPRGGAAVGAPGACSLSTPPGYKVYWWISVSPVLERAQPCSLADHYHYYSTPIDRSTVYPKLKTRIAVGTPWS